MKASELIKELQEAIEVYGDFEVWSVAEILRLQSATRAARPRKPDPVKKHYLQIA